MPSDWKIEAAERAQEEGDPARAKRLVGEILANEPTHARALALKGFIHASEAEYEESLLAHAASVTAEPRNPLYRSNHAHALIAAGRLDAAEGELLEALKIEPDFVLALHGLAWMKRVTGESSLIDRLNRVKRIGRHSGADYIRLCYALGKAYDDIGEYDLAFANYREGNERQVAPYNPAAVDRLFADIKAVWSVAFFAQREGVGYDSRKPIFVLGMPRSGTTLLEQKLAAEPGFKGLGETSEVIRLAAGITRRHPRGAQYPRWCADLPREAFAEFGRVYVDKFERRYPCAVWFIDKSLMNFAYAGLIKLALPNSLIIESRRNALDTCLSCYFQDLKISHAYSFDLKNLGHMYRGYAALMDHWRAHVDNLMTVQYEEFVEATDKHIDAIRRRLGPNVAAAPETPSHVKTWSAVQVRQPVYTTSVGRWKNYEKHLGPLIEALGDLAP